MMYVLIGLSLSLAGVAGLQFFYMIYLERIDREQKRRIRELEKHSRQLVVRLEEAEMHIHAQNEMLDRFYDEFDESAEEVWADYIHE